MIDVREAAEALIPILELLKKEGELFGQWRPFNITFNVRENQDGSIGVSNVCIVPNENFLWGCAQEARSALKKLEE